MTHVLIRMKDSNSYFVLPRKNWEELSGLDNFYETKAYASEVIAEGTQAEMFKWKALAEDDDSPTAPFFGEIK